MEQTDYSKYAPEVKTQPDMNNPPPDPSMSFGSPHRKLGDPELNFANAKWTSPDVKMQIKKDYTHYDPKNMKHQ